MGAGSRLQNAGILVAATALAFLALNAAISTAGLLGGISLTEFFADEYRIRFLSVHDNSNYACNAGGELIPGCTGYFDGAHVRIPSYHVSINSAGMRDREYQLEKPQGTYRILVLGDSTTFGEGVDIEDTYTELMETELNSRYDMLFEVFNLGVGGASTDDGYLRLLRYWNYSPDLVILQTHPNDVLECGSMKGEVDGLIWESLGLNLSDDIHDEFSARLERNTLREDYARQLGRERRCACMQENLEAIIALIKPEGFPLIILDLDYTEGDSCFDAQDGRYSHLGARHLGREYRISRGDAHLNRRGHARVAEQLLPAIIEAINRTRPEVLGG